MSPWTSSAARGALGPPDHRARLVQRRAGGAARQDEGAQLLQLGVEAVAVRLQLVDVELLHAQRQVLGLGDDRGGEVGADVEQGRSGRASAPSRPPPPGRRGRSPCRRDRVGPRWRPRTPRSANPVLAVAARCRPGRWCPCLRYGCRCASRVDHAASCSAPALRKTRVPTRHGAESAASCERELTEPVEHGCCGRARPRTRPASRRRDSADRHDVREDVQPAGRERAIGSIRPDSSIDGTRSR